jgi:hypothetical protein
MELVFWGRPRRPRSTPGGHYPRHVARQDHKKRRLVGTDGGRPRRAPAELAGLLPPDPTAGVGGGRGDGSLFSVPEGPTDHTLPHPGSSLEGVGPWVFSMDTPHRCVSVRRTRRQLTTGEGHLFPGWQDEKSLREGSSTIPKRVLSSPRCPVPAQGPGASGEEVTHISESKTKWGQRENPKEPARHAFSCGATSCGGAGANESCPRLGLSDH